MQIQLFVRQLYKNEHLRENEQSRERREWEGLTIEDILNDDDGKEGKGREGRIYLEGVEIAPVIDQRYLSRSYAPTIESENIV